MKPSPLRLTTDPEAGCTGSWQEMVRKRTKHPLRFIVSAFPAPSIRYQSRSLLRSREMAWLWIWQMRDSVTPSTSAISRRFSSCS